MKNLFRRRRRQGEREAAEAAATQTAPAKLAPPAPLIAEAIPLETQKRMLDNIRRNLHNQAAYYPR